MVLEFIGRIDAGDPAGIVSLTTLVYTFKNVGGRVHVMESAEAVKENRDEYLSAYPDCKILVQRVLRGGDGVAIVGQTTGSHLSPDAEREELVLGTAKAEDGLVAE